MCALYVDLANGVVRGGCMAGRVYDVGAGMITTYVDYGMKISSVVM